MYFLFASIDSLHIGF